MISTAPVLAKPATLNFELTLQCKKNTECQLNSNLEAQLKNDLSLAQIENDAFPAQTDFLFSRLPDEINQALRARGFYEVEIEPTLTRLKRATNIEVMVKIGAPILIRRVDITITGDGDQLLEWQNYKQFELILRRGVQLNHSNYSRTLTELKNIALNAGYLDAQFIKREFRVYPEQQVADIIIHLDTKQGYQFGQVNFSGHNRASNRILDRFIEIKPGDAFTQKAITDLQKGLINSRYFGMVRIDPLFNEQQNRQIPLMVELEDNRQQAYTIGAGFGTDTGARILLGFENRLVNRDGHNYQLDSVLGERTQSFSANYNVPGKRPLREQWSLGLNLSATQSDTLKRQRSAVSPSFIIKLDDTWQLNYFSSVEYETFQYTGQPVVSNQLLLIGTGIQKRWINNEAYPTLGYKHNATFRFSFENEVSDNEFIQVELATRGIYAPLHFWRLMARAQLGYTFAGQDQLIPSSYRYLLGGENLRGYKFESIGLGNNNEFIGGRNMLLTSLETDFRLSRFVGLGLFSDAGQVTSSGLPDSLKVGAGLGLRGFTPIGTAKLDIAWPVSEQNTSKSWRIHFSIGLDL